MLHLQKLHSYQVRRQMRSQMNHKVSSMRMTLFVNKESRLQFGQKTWKVKSQWTFLLFHSRWKGEGGWPQKQETGFLWKGKNIFSVLQIRSRRTNSYRSFHTWSRWFLTWLRKSKRTKWEMDMCLLNKLWRSKNWSSCFCWQCLLCFLITHSNMTGGNNSNR